MPTEWGDPPERWAAWEPSLGLASRRESVASAHSVLAEPRDARVLGALGQQAVPGALGEQPQGVPQEVQGVPQEVQGAPQEVRGAPQEVRGALALAVFRAAVLPGSAVGGSLQVPGPSEP